MEKLKQQIGFIGAGNMARAILSGMMNAKLIEHPQAIVSDVSVEQLEATEQITQARIAKDNADLARLADIVFFATKPYQVADVCREIKPHVRAGQLFITICAGVRTATIEDALGGKPRVIRVMPNTPALIGCGSAAVARGQYATQKDAELASRIFDSVGVAVELPEELLDLVTGLTGSGPAYVFYFTEQLIEAGKKLGLPENAANELVKQMVYGAARMAFESDKPLAELRAAVTTKGGTTEAGLRALEEAGLAKTIHKCVEAATNRSKELAGK